MTVPRTLSATPQPVRLYVEDMSVAGMARECVLLGRVAVEVVAFDGSVSTVMGETVTGTDWLTDEEVRSLRASVSGDGSRAKTHDARMRIEAILAKHEPLTREAIAREYDAQRATDFDEAWAAMLAAEEIEEKGANASGMPRYRLSLPF